MFAVIFWIWFVPAAGLTTYNAYDCNQRDHRVITTQECVIAGTIGSVIWPVTGAIYLHDKIKE